MPQPPSRAALWVLLVLLLGHGDAQAMASPGPAPRPGAGEAPAAIAPVPGPSSPDPAILARLAPILSAQRALTTVRGTLTETTSRPADPDDVPERHDVRFAIRFPDDYDLVFTRPGDDEYRLRICSDGHLRWHIERFSASDPVDASSKAVDQADPDVFARIVGFFRIDPKALERDFTIDLAASGTTTVLTLRPQGGDAARDIATITVTLDAAFHTTGIVIVDPQGNRVAIHVGHVIYGAPIDPEEFRYGASASGPGSPGADVHGP